MTLFGKIHIYKPYPHEGRPNDGLLNINNYFCNFTISPTQISQHYELKYHFLKVVLPLFLLLPLFLPSAFVSAFCPLPSAFAKLSSL